MEDSYNPKILTVDIETAPNLSYHFGMRKINIAPIQVKEPGYILCICAKWAHERNVMKFSKWEDGTLEMLKQVRDLLIEADAVVSKNGDRFDLPWINTEFLLNGLAPIPTLTSIDLEKTLRGKFRFPSTAMAYVAPAMGVGEKMDTGGFELWLDVMAGVRRAQKKMLRYCAMDVRITERMYLKMRPHIIQHPRLRAFGTEACPACGSKHSQKRGKRHTACYEIQRHQCMNPTCGKWFEGTKKKVA